MSDLDLGRPTTVADAVTMMAEGGTAYAGGTELLLAMRVGLIRPRMLVDLKGVEDLRGIRHRNGTLDLAAATTHVEIARSAAVARSIPVLARVASEVGNARVRTQGTVGGNLAFAEPKSDLTTLLLALGAEVVLASQRGTRHVDLADFLLGPYWTSREENELLTEIRVPVSPGARGVYLKHQVTERPKLGVAVVEGNDGKCVVAVGAATPVPRRFAFDRAEDIDAAAIADEVEFLLDSDGNTDDQRRLTTTLIDRARKQFQAGRADGNQ
ncbi:MAG: FAD binding domain-containing protein [Dehalococcoidia bacterium]